MSLTPHVHIIETPPELELEVEEVELDPEEDSRMGAYQTETLMRWSEYHSRQSRRQLARQHLDQHAVGVIGGYQLQAGASQREFGQFLKTLEAAGQDTKTLWASLVRRFYDKVLVLGNLCSIGVVIGILGQVCYNGSKILEALKGQAFQLGIAAILRAFCCGIAPFLIKEKYGEALRTFTQDRNRWQRRNDEEEPMDIDQGVGGTLDHGVHPIPGTSSGAFGGVAGGAATEKGHFARF